MLEPPRRGGSNEYPQSMFWSKNKKNRNTPANPFFYIKVGFKGVYIAWTCFRDGVILQKKNLHIHKSKGQMMIISQIEILTMIFNQNNKNKHTKLYILILMQQYHNLLFH